MARSRAADAARPPDLTLGELRSGDEAPWRDHYEHDGLEFCGLELAAYAAGGTRFVECRITDARFGELKLRRGRCTVAEWSQLQATTFDVTEGEWTDVVVDGGRLGALLAPGARWSRVALRGVRSNYVSLRGASVVDLTIEDCRIEELDLGGATIERARVSGEFDRLVLSAATCRGVDLRAADVGEIEGVAELRGCTVTPYQLTRLAPALAAHLGIRVEHQALERGR